MPSKSRTGHKHCYSHSYSYSYWNCETSLRGHPTSRWQIARYVARSTGIL